MNAAANSNNLSEILLQRGELQTAREQAKHAVDFIDRTEDKSWQSAFRAQLAHGLAMQGKVREAGALIQEAEQRQVPVDFPYLYAMGGFLYTSFLLRAAEPSALPGLAERAQATLKLAERYDWLLCIGLDSFNLARIAARTGDETVAAQFDAAIATLQKAGARELMPPGYLARAGFRRAQGDLIGAWEDLAQVRHIAEPSGMRLYLCDALIEETWLHHLSRDAKEARAAFEQAEAEVDAMGYHWQDPELAELRQALD
jgi:tetratricopeptide (TPR) repeat protein